MRFPALATPCAVASCRLWLHALLLLVFSLSPGPACFPPPVLPQPAPIICASAISAEGVGSMLSPQRAAAVASRGAGEASNFPRTRSVVTHAASQCSSEVTTGPCCCPSSWDARGAPPVVSEAQSSGPGLLVQGTSSVAARSSRPRAAWWSGRSSSALCRAGRAGRAARSGSGSLASSATGKQDSQS